MTWLFLSSGLFLGWSLGANDAANIFGTAVGTKMIKFKVAALVASIFVIIGAVISGAGAAHTYGKLGSINAIAGSFTAALAAAITVAWMTKLGLPVSTTQAIVGAIVGWDIFTATLIDTPTLFKILSTWIISPILTGILAFIFFKVMRRYLQVVKIHILEMDLYTRLGLILIGAFGAYSLGANNIANVMGVFVGSNPFGDINLKFFTLTGTQVLFFIGGVSIAVGIYTYSYKVMQTVGSDLTKLSPVAALIVVLAESIVLFIFASESLERLLLKAGLPPIPLVPVSSSQAVVGGVVGVALARGAGRTLNLRVLFRIFWGWIATPVSAAIIAFFSLFIMQNVFQQKVYEPIPYCINGDVISKLRNIGIVDPGLKVLEGKVVYGSRNFKNEVARKTHLGKEDVLKVVRLSEVDSLLIDSVIANERLDPNWFTPAQLRAVKKLHGRLFVYKWQLMDALASITPEWKLLPPTRKNKLYNKELKAKYQVLFKTFQVERVRRA